MVDLSETTDTIHSVLADKGKEMVSPFKPLQLKKKQNTHTHAPKKKRLRGTKRRQPCGQKLIFLLVAHCCRRANMPQENSSTHTPLFSSGFSQLYTPQQSHNWEQNQLLCVSPGAPCVACPAPGASPWSELCVCSLFDCDGGEARSVIAEHGRICSSRFRFEPLPHLSPFLLNSFEALPPPTPTTINNNTS